MPPVGPPYIPRDFPRAYEEWARCERSEFFFGECANCGDPLLAPQVP